ncbi:MAG TPA: alanine--tRNA ligase-related protein [Ktedonobacterales bacterium]|nr:alanine--tRNA ligase-related protein [Ktedonobacterales bacterium]
MRTQMKKVETRGDHETRRWSAEEIAREYVGFFRKRGHLEIAGSPLVVPENTTSFVIAGMQPLIPYLRGDVSPPAERLVDLQRCLRTDDVDAVGSNGRKLTSFHMLGNWSVGGYGRREATRLALELLAVYGVDRERLWVTVFAGEPGLGLARDEEVIAEWRAADVPEERIVPLGMDDNFWTAGGPGPCGPNSELFVDRGEALGCGRAECAPGCACERFLEIWNLVFIEFERHEDGHFSPLPLRSVDTGMGLERMAVVLQEAPSIFEIDLFWPALERLRALEGSGDGDEARAERARRVIVDHARAALLAGLAGVVPGNLGRASVLRRLIRRAARQGRALGIERPFLGELLEPLARAHGSLLTVDEQGRVAEVARMVTDEERRFARVLTAGLRALERIVAENGGDEIVPGERLFLLHAERGFPADLAAEVLAERGLAVDWSGYEQALAGHRAVSRVSAERRFRGRSESSHPLHPLSVESGEMPAN